LVEWAAQRSVALTTNKPFSEWSEVFPHAACTVTLVDRLIRRAEVHEVVADSFRLKEAKELGRNGALSPSAVGNCTAKARAADFEPTPTVPENRAKLSHHPTQAVGYPTFTGTSVMVSLPKMSITFTATV
jgi:hypothetical protein